MPIYEVRIEPLEPLLFGDNRSARAGFDHLLQDQDPSPLTIHGAIGQYLADRSKDMAHRAARRETERHPQSAGKVARLLGFCLHGVGSSLYFPRPRHLRCTLSHGKPYPTDLVMPREGDGARTSAPWSHLLFPSDDEMLDDEAEGQVALRESALGDVLCGDVPASAELPFEPLPHRAAARYRGGQRCRHRVRGSVLHPPLPPVQACRPECGAAGRFYRMDGDRSRRSSSIPQTMSASSVATDVEPASRFVKPDLSPWATSANRWPKPPRKERAPASSFLSSRPRFRPKRQWKWTADSRSPRRSVSLRTRAAGTWRRTVRGLFAHSSPPARSTSSSGRRRLRSVPRVPNWCGVSGCILSTTKEPRPVSAAACRGSGDEPHHSRRSSPPAARRADARQLR